MSYEERGQWVYLAATTIAYGALQAVVGAVIKLGAYRRGF